MRRSISGVAAFGLVGVGAVGLGASGAAAPAQAFAGTCPVTVPAATLVADNVCEVRITTVGSSTFTPPTGITKLSAVLVAGGGGAQRGSGVFYGGSGGSVVYIDSVPTGAPISLTVGVGGDAGDTTVVPSPVATAGGDTTLVAGSTTTATGGISGDTGSLPFCTTATTLFGSGNGARTNTDASCVAGAGFSLSQLSGLDAALFPAASLGPEVYGDGGTGSEAGPVVAATSFGTGGSVDSADVQAGTAGLVILRFAPAAPVTPPAPTLAATGVEVSSTVPAAASAMVVLGAVILAGRRRRKTAR